VGMVAGSDEALSLASASALALGYFAALLAAECLFVNSNQFAGWLDKGLDGLEVQRFVLWQRQELKTIKKLIKTFSRNKISQFSLE
jgi:hypothetical protein